MNKTELIEAVATRSNTTKAQTATMLDGLLEVIQQTLTGGNNVQLVGFGTFSITERAGREGRNGQIYDNSCQESRQIQARENTG